MADFEEAFKIVLQCEGGYANLPEDTGQETYRGIARHYQSQWDGWPIIDSLRHQPVFPKILDNNQDLQEKVRYFYTTHFWPDIKGPQLPQINADDLMHMAVNKGAHRAIGLFQDALGVPVTGKMDGITLNKINGIV